MINEFKKLSKNGSGVKFEAKYVFGEYWIKLDKMYVIVNFLTLNNAYLLKIEVLALNFSKIKKFNFFTYKM